MIVYKITNSVNEKVYIGQSCRMAELAGLGRNHTPESIEKMRLAKIGNNHRSRKLVVA